MDLNERTTLYAHLSDNVGYIRLLLIDFERTYDNEDILSKIPTAPWAYTYNIVISLAKVFTHLNQEHYRLQRFKELGSENISERIIRLETDHKSLIEKIISNRHQLFAHTGINFNKFLFSKEEVVRLEEKFGRAFSNLAASKKKDERFTPIDVKNDLDELRSILDELDGIWQEAIVSDIGLG